jgi:hypothetical protein
VGAPSSTPEPPAATETSAPSPEATVTTELKQVGPFVQVSSEEARIAGTVLDLVARPDGGIWLLSEGGFSEFRDGEWTGYLVDSVGEVVGIDAEGRFWVVSPDGSKISAWDGQAWSEYGPLNGWLTAERTSGRIITSGIITDLEGRIWLATGSDVRSFNQGEWRIYTPGEIGLLAPETLDYLVTFEIAYDPMSAQVWVGSCHWAGPGPVGGGGIARLVLGEWQIANPEAEPGCVSAIRPALEDGVWAGIDNTLWQYSPGGGWRSFAPPAAPQDVRFGFYTNLTAAPDGSLWPELALCGGASCYAGEALYRMQAGDWIQIGNVEEAVGRQVFFDGAGKTWLLSGGVMHQVIEGVPVPSSDLIVLAATVDQSGRLWMVAQGDGPATMWSTVQD